MGGWIALHLALLRRERVRALVGIAAAPDFTDWGFAPAQVAQLGAEGRLTRGFWESGQRLLLLDKELPVDCPVRLLHGERDEEVPLDIAFKGGGHRLSEPNEIDAILRTVVALLEPNP
jgi:pimeloyl-ACP methyl ester carboxylesterase